MPTLSVARGRLLTASVAALAAFVLVLPAAAIGATTDPDLVATVELDDGDVAYEVEVDALHFFSDAGQPLALQVIDGCDVNGNLWLFGAGLSGIPIRVTLVDRDSGASTAAVLPPFEPGKPVGTLLDPEALPLCREDIESGGLPLLDAVATFTGANAASQDGSDIVTLVSDGSDNAYRRLLRDDISYDVITRGSPIVAVDDDGRLDQVYLISESRTPRQLEGIVFSGAQGMIARNRLARSARNLTKARVRRAYETAKSGRVPRNIIEDLGLRRVDRVHHVSLSFDQLGADAYLAEARWIQEGGARLEPPKPVEERFTVELVGADGERVPVPLVGPLVGSDAAGTRWEYATDQAMVQIYDACALDGTMWVWAGARTDAPLELVITDGSTGGTVSHVVWTDGREISRLSDTSTLAACA
jgi:hypothetical protein